jgi:predicted lipoprotein
LRGLGAAQVYNLEIIMRNSLIPLAVAVVVLALPGCKLVKNEDSPAGQAASADPITTLADATFESKLLPHIAKTALPVADLRTAIATDLAAAGTAHGNRGAGEGAAWAFAVKGEGKVVSANLTSRARQADLDTDGDGIADLSLALGPVIKGTALRDVAPFYVFGDFRDQIEFAQLARALNDKVSPLLILPEGDLTGKSMTFTGVVPIKSAKDAWVVTAVSVAVKP